MLSFAFRVIPRAFKGRTLGQALMRITRAFGN